MKAEATDQAGKAASVEEHVRFDQTCPILRIFDEPAAKEFYLGFLGFHLDWEHRFGEDYPLYAQVSRAGLILHLSGHHGDACPGSALFVPMQGIGAFHRELSGKNHKHTKPSIADEAWGLIMEVTDPFGNRLRFCQRKEEGVEQPA
ncbi:glyoxalase superfamily protein [Sphingosinicella rhizophila]|uniref:Bleomycin resistance protein n=1 Tax=Sphingosinicella rhizophila TaxID=3050082 RepID=A0ABU3Q790_9SPHN|nr:glyoxalase superfamily protein [Sphingosinicella sp. GR2756]MDT9599261.1 glyoxalase superfamily protein [Sphingosinicella sp. GR2756]